MGYTRYWSRTDKPITEEFVKSAKKIIKDSEDKGIHICGACGQGEPVISSELVSFNGNGALGLDHETCFFDNQERGFNFCKTARKPYDYTVREVLKVAEAEGLIADVSSDGENNEIISDEQAVSNGYAS